jgi:SAM-dependent methyltransferase
MELIKRWFEFNRWYLRRDQPPWDTGISPPELYAFIESHPPGRALDLGCGTGTNVITLAQLGWQVTGVDFAIRAISVAKRKARAANIYADLRVGDVTHLNGIAGPFDLIIDIGCFHGLLPNGQAAYARQVKHFLAPGGTFLLYVMFKENSQSVRSGVIESDLSRYAPELQVVARTDSIDAARGGPSAWLMYQHAINTHRR